MNNTPKLIPSARLEQLKKYLNYELSTSVLFFLSMWGMIFLILAAAAAVIFAPFMLYTLAKENKKGWLIFFLILVMLPLVTLGVISLFYGFIKPLLLVPIGLFYLYCFILRFEVNNWVKEIKAKNTYRINKIKQQKEDEIFLRQFK